MANDYEDDNGTSRQEDRSRTYEIPAISSYLPPEVEEVLAARLVRNATLIAAILLVALSIAAGLLLYRTREDLRSRQAQMTAHATRLDSLGHALKEQLERTRELNDAYAESYAQALARFETDALQNAYEAGRLIGTSDGVLKDAQSAAARALTAVERLQTKRSELDKLATRAEATLDSLSSTSDRRFASVQTRLKDLLLRRQVGGVYSIREGTRRRLHGTGLTAEYSGSADGTIRRFELRDSADAVIYGPKDLTIEGTDSTMVNDIVYQIQLRGVDRPFFRTLPWIENSTAEVHVQVIHPPAEPAQDGKPSSGGDA